MSDTVQCIVEIVLGLLFGGGIVWGSHLILSSIHKRMELLEKRQDEIADSYLKFLDSFKQLLLQEEERRKQQRDWAVDMLFDKKREQEEQEEEDTQNG